MWILVILRIKRSLKAELQSKELLPLYSTKYSRNTRNRPPKMRRFSGRLEDRASGGLFATRSRHFYFLEKTWLIAYSFCVSTLRYVLLHIVTKSLSCTLPSNVVLIANKEIKPYCSQAVAYKKFNPLSPNSHKQILQTDLYTFL